MDERFEKIISKLDTQAETAIEMNKKLSTIFNDVSKSQKDLDGKVTEIKKELDEYFFLFLEIIDHQSE